MTTQKIVTVKNVHGCVDKNGTVWLNAEDIARRLRFVQTKNGVEYVQWETVNNYLRSCGFSKNVGKDDFIPENTFYRLAMKASNETAQVFQEKIIDVIIPAIRRTGFFSSKPLSLAQQTAMQVQLNLQFEERFGKVEDTLTQQGERLDKVIDTIKHLQDRNNAVALNSKSVDIKQLKEVVTRNQGPSGEIKTLISEIVSFTATTNTPYSYKAAYDLFYDMLKQNTGIRICTRINNLRKRMKEQGLPKTKIKQISGLDAITADPMTWARVRDVIDILKRYLNEAREG